ncbi:MAG: hypothetical protein IJ864_03465 [Alphaproteobacteria bacterium]|nr:hypothetical protein [Alphaproteobacteria bacterium]
MRKLQLIVLFLCLSFSPTGLADTETLNWCGTYFEDNDQSFLRIARADLFTGSNQCNIDEYYEKVTNTGHINLALNRTKNRNVVGQWRKFTNHIIEVRGKMHRGMITGTRLVRDIGV